MKVIVYPYDKNPYQRLLYTDMRKEYGKKIKIRYSFFLPYVGALHFPLELVIRRAIGYRIVHIHWVAFFLQQNIPNKFKWSWFLTRYNLWVMKKLGYKIVWTVHDITPHQQETLDDIDIAIRLSNLCDRKIIHSSFAEEQMEKAGLNINNCVVIPHGNYDGVYENALTIKQARRELGITDGGVVVLFFGIIKNYKGVDHLLEAYEKIRTAKTTLVIAGTCSDPVLNTLLDEASKNKDIIVHRKYIDNSDVATYFKASDIVCLPFKAITTSGSTLLALTFGKPIVAPREGSLKDIPLGVGYLYSPTKKNGLEKSLHDAFNNKNTLKQMSSASRKYADSLAWKGIAEKTYQVYADLYYNK